MTDPSAELLELGAATLGGSGETPMNPGIAAFWAGATVAGPAFVAACGQADNLALHVAAAARGLVLRGATKTKSGAVGGTTDVGGVAVSTGDWIVGDRDGVVVIPHDQLADVLGAGRERAAKEASMFTALRSGSTTVELLDLDTTAVTRPT